MDNHFSHVNIAFIEKCDKFYILLLILLSYIIYHLQPFDVAFFSFLFIYYTNGLNKLMFNNLRIIGILKRTFWSVFIGAWEQVFTVENIFVGFKKAGNWPLDIMSQIKVIIKFKVFKILISLQTPLICRIICRIQQKFANKLSPIILVKIFRVNI